MKRVLMVAPYFLPRRRVGAMRPFRFAIHLREQGWQPTVVTLASSGELTPREASALDGIDVRGLRSPLDLTQRSESQLSVGGSRGDSPPQATSQGRATLLEAAFPVDTWLPLYCLRYPELVRLARQQRPHVLWATGDPWSALVVSEAVARRVRVPFVADFRNPWTLCKIRTGERYAPTNALNRWFERRVIQGAAHTVFCAQRTEAKYQGRYGKRLVSSTIYNSFDSGLFEPGEDEPAAPATVLHVGFFGRFRAMSPAAPLIAALALARRRRSPAADRVVVHSFGPLPAHEAEQAVQGGVAASFRQESAVPLEQAVRVLRRFDLLLVSTNPDRDEIVPAKLFESLAARRPILSLASNPEVGRILDRTGAGTQLPIDRPDRILDLIERCLEAKVADRPLPVASSLSPAAEFEATETTRQLAKVLDSVAQ